MNLEPFRGHPGEILGGGHISPPHSFGFTLEAVLIRVNSRAAIIYSQVAISNSRAAIIYSRATIFDSRSTINYSRATIL